MASAGKAFFDSKGVFFRTPEEATISDLSAVLGRIGEADGLTQGIAKIMIEQRAAIERVFAEHDAMIRPEPNLPVLVDTSGNVASIRQAG